MVQAIIATCAAAALGLAAIAAVVTASAAPRTSLMAVRLPNGRIINAVPVQSLFGPGDLPMPIEVNFKPSCLHPKPQILNPQS